MKTFFKYGFLFLAVLILGSLVAEAQEEVRRRSLLELQQLEKGYEVLNRVEPIIMHELPEAPEIPDFLILSYQGTTNMRLWKEVDDLSTSKKFTFNVEKDYSDIYFQLKGKASDGIIKIKLIRPDNKVLKELSIVPQQEQHWQQSYCLQEIDNPGFKGKWSVELSCSQATGYYQFAFKSR